MSTKKTKEPAKKIDNSWDESTAGGDYVTLPSGNYIARVRSVISCGQVQFEFKGELDEKATSAIAIVLEIYDFDINKKKGTIKVKGEPAIVSNVYKALRMSAKSHYAKMFKALDLKNIGDLVGMAVGVDVYTSDKDYMYIRGGLTSLGLSEMKAVPKLQGESFTVPNLNCMTVDAMKELNPLREVKDYVLKAVNFPDSEAEKCVATIRKTKPDFAIFVPKEDADGAKPKGKKGKKKKLSETETY